MKPSGEYERVESGADGQGVAADGTHAKLMHLTASLASSANSVMRASTIAYTANIAFMSGLDSKRT